MSLEWKYEKLGKLCSFDKEGVNPKEDIKYYHYSFPAFDNNKEPEVEVGKDIKSSKFLFNKGDILFNKLNVKFKRVWDIDFDIDENSICSTEFIPIQAKNIDRNFLYYCLISPNFTNEMKYLSTGTSNSHQRINPKDIKDYDLFLPTDEEIQKKIGYILKLLDKKISMNVEINKNLEELMHVLFKKYFIDNNPFYVENDEKWNIIKLKDLIIRNRDKINDFDNWKDELLIDLSNMPRFSIAISNFDKGKKFTSNIYKLNKYDLLFGSIRPYFGKVGFSPINGVVTGTVHSFKPIDDIYYSLVLSLISSKTFINYTVSVSKGTKMPSVKWDDFINYEFAIPDDLSKIGEYNKILLPLIHKIEKNILEIQRLTKLRDTLLPKLMSGEIDVSKINCDLKIIIRKIYIKSSKLFLWRYLSENQNHIKNTKSNETLLKSRAIHKINKFLAKFNARYRYYRQ